MQKTVSVNVEHVLVHHRAVGARAQCFQGTAKQEPSARRGKNADAKIVQNSTKKVSTTRRTTGRRTHFSVHSFPFGWVGTTVAHIFNLVRKI